MARLLGVKMDPGARRYLLTNPETRAVVEHAAADILAFYRSLPWYQKVAVRVLGFLRR